MHPRRSFQRDAARSSHCGVPSWAISEDVSGAGYNCPADNPPLWVRTARQALARIE